MAERRRRRRNLTGVVLLAVALCLAAGATAGAVPSRDPGLPQPVQSSEEVKARARHILSGPDYQGPHESRNLIDRIRDWIRRHMPHLPGSQGRTSRQSFNWFSWVVVIALLVGVGVLVALGLSRTGRGRREDEEDREGGDEVEVVPLRTGTEWEDEARRLEASGTWREALRARYRAVTGSLAERGVVTDVPGRTAGEQRVEVGRNAPTVTAPFTTVSELFERTWFGHEPVSETEVGEARRLGEFVLAGAPRRVEATETAAGSGTEVRHLGEGPGPADQAEGPGPAEDGDADGAGQGGGVPDGAHGPDGSGS